MSRAVKITMGVGAVALLALSAALVYVWVIRDDPAPELVLGETRPTEAPGSTSSAAPAPTTTTPSTSTAPEGIEGQWVADPLSVAGYRVVEDFRGIPDFEAVGRTTTPIDASVFIEGTTVTDAVFTVDVAGIESPESLRDGQFRRVMATDDFPTAVLRLTEPIDLGELPAEGETVTYTATGDLKLKDTTRSVTFEITAQRQADTIETLSQIPVVFSAFDIDTPSAPGITVQDDGLLEASIIFRRPG